MSVQISSRPAGDGVHTTKKEPLDPGTKVLPREPGTSSSERPKVKASAGEPAEVAEAAPTGARQAIAGAGKHLHKHVPHPPAPTQPVPPTAPGGTVFPPFGTVIAAPAAPAPLPGTVAGGPRPDQSLTQGQQQEVRETLIDHGISPDEADRIVQQLVDGTPVFGLPTVGGGAAPLVSLPTHRPSDPVR